MPEQLKVHSGERVDLVDYVHGANTYTQEAQKFLLEREWLDRRSRILDGFRVKIEDQTANPGMITVYNGNAADRAGQLINNEETVNDSRSVTLLGASLNFYVEIEFIQNASDTDARFLWDPTIANTAPEPDGAEFGLNVATRITPDWRVVYPVSTTAFDQVADANSIRVPVGVFSTDGANRVVVGATNPGLTLVRAASVLEVDASTGDPTIRVVDSRIFPATTPFDITVDVGGVSPEARTVSGIDRDNGILSLSSNLGANHLAGAIIRVTSGLADLVRENIDPSDPALDSSLPVPGHPDPAQRLWQANEVRGSALIQSKETAGARDDLNIRSLKDQMDYLAGQLRELKFGAPRPDVISTAPPAAFGARPRWFDRAGSVTGGRANTVSIGNGTTSFGDFNGTDGTALVTAAIAALPAAGGTIYVKAGTYNFATTVSVGKPVVFVGEHYATCIFQSTNAGGSAISTSANLLFDKITFQQGGGADETILEIVGAITVTFDYSVFVGQMSLVAVNASVVGTNSSFTASGGNPIILGTTVAATLTNSVFVNCAMTGSLLLLVSTNNVRIDKCLLSTLAALSVPTGAGNSSKVSVTNCTISTTYVLLALSGVSGAVTDFLCENNRITVASLASLQAVVYVASTGTNARVCTRNNYILTTGGVSTAVSPGHIVFLENAGSHAGFEMSNNHVEVHAGSFIRGCNLDQDNLVAGVVRGNYFYRTVEAVHIGGAVGTPSAGSITVSGNYHDNAGEHADVYGVKFSNNARLVRVDITDNVCINYNRAGIGSRAAADLSTTSTSKMIVAFERNRVFDVFATTAPSTGHGFYFAPNVGSVLTHSFVVRDNVFTNLRGETTMAAVHIANDGSATNNMTAKVENNLVYLVGFGANTGRASGIRVDGLGGTDALVSISGNDVSYINTSDGTVGATGIDLLRTRNALVTGNRVATVVSSISAGDPLAVLGCCVRVTCGVNDRDIRVSDNVLSQIASLVPTSSQYVLNVLHDAASTLENVALSDNIIHGSTSTTYGIGVSGVAAIANLLIHGNVISFPSDRSNAAGIYVLAGPGSRNIGVKDNMVDEYVYDASCITHRGIHIQCESSSMRTVHISGNTLRGPKSGAVLSNANRVGIWLRGAIIKTSITNNVIDWNEPSVLVGISIGYDGTIAPGSWSGHLCSGNFIRGDNSSAVGGEIDIDTTNYINGFVFGNLLGEPSAVGNINPSVAAGNWDYGGTYTNKPF